MGVMLVEAALRLDLAEMQQAVSTLPAKELLAATSGGRTVAHAMSAALVFWKAGELSQALPWPNASRTVYVFEATRAISRAFHPVIRRLLDLAPALATKADVHGLTPLHLAARQCAEPYIYELLHAGASPLAATAHGERTPLDDAMHAGCIEGLALMMRMLGRADRRAAAERVLAYAVLPGAALAPSSLASILPAEDAATSRHRVRPALEQSPEEPAAPCAEGGGWDVEAPPTQTERERCDIEQLSNLGAVDFFERFYRHSRPVLVRGALSLRQRCVFARDVPDARAPTRASDLLSKRTRCGRTAYPSLTGQSTCGSFSITDLNRHPACTDPERTLPVCAHKPTGGVNTTAGFRQMPVGFRYADDVSPMPILDRTWRNSGSRQLFAGGRGSGAAMHFHNSAYNVQFFGVKRWLLTPPRYAAITGGVSSRWAEEQRRVRALPEGLPLRCTQGPGDLLLLPAHWGHATVNSAFALGIGNLYCDTRLANYSGDPHCRSFWPRDLAPAVPAGGRRTIKQRSMRMIFKEAFGGGFASDGRFQWPSWTAPAKDAARPTRMHAATPAARPTARSTARATARAAARTAGRAAGRTPARGSRNRRAARLLRSLGAVASRPPLGLSARQSTGRGVPPGIRLAPVRPECARGQPQYRRIAFVHINKAGGTSMRAKLYQFAHHQLLEANSPTAVLKLRSLGSRFFHASASLQRRVLGESAWREAFTFALVRNPYARQVSMFHFLLQEASCNRPIGMRPTHCELRKLPAPGPWLKDQTKAIVAFRLWVRQMRSAFPPDSKDAHLFGARSHGNELDGWFNASQISWLVDQRGELLVNKVIKLEELQSRWPELQASICGLAQTPYADQLDLRRNPSSHAHYSLYYDAETRRIVDEYMSADLASFGYTFEPPPSEAHA